VSRAPHRGCRIIWNKINEIHRNTLQFRLNAALALARVRARARSQFRQNDLPWTRNSGAVRIVHCSAIELGILDYVRACAYTYMIATYYLRNELENGCVMYEMLDG